MIEYGYINENECLTSKILEEFTERYKDEESGEIKNRKISIEEQAEKLRANGWKPVRVIDYTCLSCEDENYTVTTIPFDAGEYIDYEYKKIFDIQKVRSQIKELKSNLSKDDYKITKCYEASLLSENLPYNVAELHSERNQLRSKVNELEDLLRVNS